ncbi:unnamed protein product [Cyclocybe aegerita]|uniref:Uncharacterized protein n=1 Tax=Cyclocybe aegerita TaxID=1973307 RepID=A0A8S0VZU5_CYCAE|nr:unnamed protein product [Cyclocybe aegerita]
MVDTQRTPEAGPSTTGPTDASSAAEAIRRKAEVLDQIVRNALSAKTPEPVLLQQLQDAGTTPQDAAERLSMYTRMRRQTDPARNPLTIQLRSEEDLPDSQQPSRAHSPAASDDHPAGDNGRQEPVTTGISYLDAIDEAAWATLKAKIGYAALPPARTNNQGGAPTTEPDLAARLAAVLGVAISDSPSTIPASVLTGAPHLTTILELGKHDKHISET